MMASLKAHLSNSLKVQTAALICGVFMKFGDAVEMYLPAVITQQVSCELGISVAEEHVAALCLYPSLAVMSIIAIPISNKIGRRTLLLIAMYLGIIVTLICSIVFNYTVLVFSRIMMGFTIALNHATSAVYVTELSESKEFTTFSITLMSTVFSLGAGWCGLLGYFFLGWMSWRYFILITSLPFFVPPLVLLHLHLPETRVGASKLTEGEALIENTPPLRYVMLKITKLAVYRACNGFVYSGDMLLVPVIMRRFNKSLNTHVPCDAIHGIQFLVITALFGVCHIAGRFLNYLFHKKFSSEAVFLIVSSTALPFTLACSIFPHDNRVIFLSFGFIQIFLSMASNEANVCSNDKDFFSSKYIAAAAGFLMCIFNGTLFLTNILSEMLDYRTTLLAHTGCSAIYAILSLGFFIFNKFWG